MNYIKHLTGFFEKVGADFDLNPTHISLYMAIFQLWNQNDRAAQLATFAILLKAAKYYRDIFSKGWLPNVYAMPEEKNFSLQDIKDFLGTEGIDYTEELDAALRLMKQSKNLGSVMKLAVSKEAQTFIAKRFNELKTAEYLDINLQGIFQSIKNYIPVLLLLIKKYTAVVANPPYMGQGTMNAALKNYVNANYPLSKSDLFAVFMEVTLDMSVKRGLMGMINQHSWMFLSSYEKLREHILSNYGIVNMLHLGPRTFEELSGEVVQSTAFVIEKAKVINKATYYRLVEYKVLNEKESHFLNKNNEYRNISQENFEKIPGNPISYWASKINIDQLENLKKLGDYEDCKKGADTGNNNKFLRFWHEVDKFKLDFGNKWIFYNKGGTYRRWYGNFEYTINWENNGQELNSSSANLRSKNLYFQDSLTWNALSSGNFCIRFSDKKTIFDSAGSSMFLNKNVATYNYYLGLLNSKVIQNYLLILNPTFNYGAGTVSKLPIVIKKSNAINELVQSNVNISKKDWISNELSDEFNDFYLITDYNNLKSAFQKWQENATQDFFQLHANEEELNRIFIDIYGLQEELTSEVALKDITILQKELNGKDLEKLEPVFRKLGANAITLPINKAEVISQFISYAIGLFMGRYRIDKPGLNIAHPNPTDEELKSYSYNKGTVTIDEDAILPLMGKNCNFSDDVLQQFNQLLDTIWGHETRIENSNFIQECLGKELEKFLVKDFYKYHCSMYKKKPIYWLFTSKAGAFQVLVYMHRMNAFTVEKIRANYMLEHLKNLRSEESLLQSKGANLNTQEARRLDQIRKDLVECEAYDMELKNVADQQITFDLDDGVTANYAKFESVLAKIK